MTTEAIERTLELEAPIEDVWRALTDPTELSGWFGDSAELNPTAGGEGWFGWEQHGRFAVRVEAFEPMRRFAWRWSKKPGTSIEEGDSTLVEWRLEPRPGGGTTLHLRESGFREEAHRQGNVQGWRDELAELVAMLEAA